MTYKKCNLNVHVYLSTIEFESRIEKETASIMKLGLAEKIIVFGLHEPHLAEQEELSEGVGIYRQKLSTSMKNRQGLLSLFSRFLFGFKFIQYCLAQKPEIISVHATAMLPFAYYAKKRIGARMIYVPHELELKRSGMGKVMKFLTKIIESRYIYKADGMTVVCEPIKKWYEDYYGVKGIATVPNIPHHPHPGKITSSNNIFREKFGISDSSIIFIYQGVLTEKRGVLDVIEVFKQAEENKHLVLMGYGDLSDAIEQTANTTSNIHYQPAVAREDIIKYTSSADLGIWFCEEMSLSMQYALPNKFFEYAISGLYILVSENFVEQARLISENDLGSTVRPRKKDLLEAVNSMNLDLVNGLQKSSSSFRQNVSWTLNEEAIEQVYSGALKLTKLP